MDYWKDLSGRCIESLTDKIEVIGWLMWQIKFVIISTVGFVVLVRLFQEIGLFIALPFSIGLLIVYILNEDYKEYKERRKNDISK